MENQCGLKRNKIYKCEISAQIGRLNCSINEQIRPVLVSENNAGMM